MAPVTLRSYTGKFSVRGVLLLYSPTYGYKVWRGTSSGDGILRNGDDIEGIIGNYLSANAEAAGTSPRGSYLGVKMPVQLKPVCWLMGFGWRIR